MRLQPAGEPQVGNADGVIRVIVREKESVDPTDRHADLVEPDGRAAPGIDEQFLITGLDQRAGPKPIGTRRWHAGPE